MTDQINALVWSEGSAPEDVYPNGIAATIAEHLNERDDMVAKAATLTEPHDGVSHDRLQWADVLLWWGHVYHAEVSDATVERIENAMEWSVLEGFVALHSGHYAKPFTHLIDASGDLGEVRHEDGESERLTVEDPDHPVAEGVEDFTIPEVEMFGEPFDVPDPESVVLRSTFDEGGEFRSCVTFDVDGDRVAYFRPGHETYRIYHQPEVRRVIANLVRWGAGEV